MVLHQSSFSFFNLCIHPQKITPTYHTQYIWSVLIDYIPISKISELKFQLVWTLFLLPLFDRHLPYYLLILSIICIGLFYTLQMSHLIFALFWGSFMLNAFISILECSILIQQFSPSTSSIFVQIHVFTPPYSLTLNHIRSCFLLYSTMPTCVVGYLWILALLSPFYALLRLVIWQNTRL